MGDQTLVAFWGSLLVVSGCFFITASAIDGDADPLYKNCLELCVRTGCIGDTCFQGCRFSTNDVTDYSPWYMQEPLYLQWKQWDCKSDCRYHCMMETEKKRGKLGLGPAKYHGKWPFKRVLGLQEPASVALSASNLAMQFHGWMSFIILLYYKLPLKPQTRKPYYEFSGLWIIYGILSTNSCLWSTVFYSRDVGLTEKLHYSSAVAFLGYSLVITILRTFNVKDEAARVMVAAPFVAFIVTHIMYLNFYRLDYGLNMKVCVTMKIAQLLLLAGWAGATRGRLRFKLWAIVFVSGASMLLEMYDFPPINGHLDARALQHAATALLAYLWWSFIKADAEYSTTVIINKQAEKGESKKLLAVGVMGYGVWMSSQQDECRRFLALPVLVAGALVLVISLTGFVGALKNVAVLLWIYLAILCLILLALLVVTVLAFVITNSGSGEIVPRQRYKEYKLQEYSSWFRKQLNNAHHWGHLKTCLTIPDDCKSLPKEYKTLKQYRDAILTPIEAGCCRPPSECGYPAVNASFYDLSFHPVSTNKDCKIYKNSLTTKCYDCDSCKAGVAQYMKTKWKTVAIFNIVLFVVLASVYLVGCCARRNASTARSDKI